ncbi:MFS general substrate transporter [Acephala macrosclerotiorum]|nr:MFS general substrate transporter [Acephala macrosclerotiorum]
MGLPASFDVSFTPPDGEIPVVEEKDEKLIDGPVVEEDQVRINLEKELYDSTKIDPVLARKMALVNDAIDEIGMTPFQWKLFFLNGFGYAVDSLLIVCQSIANPAVTQEYGNPSKHIQGVPLASQVGLLFLCAIFVLIGGAMPSYISFSAIVAIYSAGAGGNYILDATNFLEFLPGRYAWLVRFLSMWWTVGYTVTGLFAWAFVSNYSRLPDAMVCTRADNMGWRYLHFTCGALVIGRVLHTEKSVWSGIRVKLHFSGPFETKKLAGSTTVIIANWFVIGMVSPLYSVFLPFYLASRGADVGDNSNYTVWRDYAINQIAGLGPIIAVILVETKYLGRRGTLAIGALVTMFQFGYTQITTPAPNVGVSAAISAASNIYYGTIYAYTSEILPSAHRATRYGLCVVLNRVGGIAGVLVGSYANVETTAPLFVWAALFGLLVILSILLPFEPKGRRSQ